MKKLVCFAAALLVFQTASAQLHLTVKDAFSAKRLAAATVVFEQNGKAETRLADRFGQLNFEPNGAVNLTISASGFQSQRTHFTVENGQSLDAEIWLDSSNENIANNSKSTSYDENGGTISAYILDKMTGEPLVNVAFESKFLRLKTATDAQGFFTINYRRQPSDAEILVADFTLSNSNFRRRRGYFSFSVGSTILLKLDLERGEPTKASRPLLFDHAQQFDVQQNANDAQWNLFPKSPLRGLGDDPSVFSTKFPQNLSKIANCQVPATIRVGTNCSCTTCTGAVISLSLDTYVGQGIDDEIYSSWHANSLKANAVAYRSYGAYFVLNQPLRQPNYDIASTTCNQVFNGATVAASCVAAANATSREVLEKNGATAKSEYAAENNNAGCGDGFAGTGTTWACIADSLCKGRTTNGHGRGLCQWGTQFWARDAAKTYDWILDHYYLVGDMRRCLADELNPTDEAALPSDVESLTISPNPNGGRFAVDVKMQAAQSVSVRIFNAVGQVLENTAPQYSARFYKEFDIKTVGNSIYMVEIRWANGRVLRRVEVVK